MIDRLSPSPQPRQIRGRITNSRIRRRRTSTPPSEGCYKLTFTERVLAAARTCQRTSAQFEEQLQATAIQLRAQSPLLALYGPSGRLYETAPEPSTRSPLTHLYCLQIITSGQTLAIDDTGETRSGIGAFLGVPVRIQGRNVGALCVVDARARRWELEELRCWRELATLVETRIESALTLSQT